MSYQTMGRKAVPSVLMVEDDPTLARSVLRVLKREGFAVWLFSSAAEARAVSGPFDAAVLDIELGDGDGVTLGTELLERGVIQRACFFSAANDAELVARAAALGRFVDKAAGARALVDALTETLAANAPPPNPAKQRSSSAPRARRRASGTRRRASTFTPSASKLKLPRSA